MMDSIVVDESPSLSHAVLRGHLAPVDSAALACLPVLPDEVRSLLERHVFAAGKPLALARHETPIGSIALIVLPRLASEIYADRKELRRLVGLALEEARRVGARVVSLTGLIPSATSLGTDVLPDPSRDLPAITTGHATTVSAVALMLADGINAAGLDLTQETLAFVGVGSIGAASLRLALRVLPKPERVLLCDVFQAKERVEQLARAVSLEFGVEVEVTIAAGNSVPDRLYDARVLVGATNVPNVLDVSRLRPGSVLIDDSAPHCFDVAQARARLESRGDILFSEGGLVRSPERLSHRIFLPNRVRHAAELLLTSTLRQQLFAPDQIMGCVLSSALSALPKPLPRTVGPVDPADAMAHYAALRSMNFAAPPPQCDAQRFARKAPRTVH